MKLCEPRECTGCMACVNVCKHNAIKIVTNNEGFDHPVIIEDSCTNCGLCQMVCPILNPVKYIPNKKDVYACWSNNKEIRLNSSSGGLFTVLAKYVLKQNGVVFGAAFDNNFNVYHTHIINESEIEKLRGSKYVQSKIGSSFIDAKNHLENNKLVLFTGTPCQIAGLKKFILKDYNNLITLDLVCHGVPSPLIFNDYKKYIENILNNKITDIKFRDKKYSWIYYNILINKNNNNGTYDGKYYSDPYIRGFLNDFYLRPACYNCKFTNLNRTGDITIADYWGYKGRGAVNKNYAELGVSLAIVNTKKGKGIFDNCKNDLVFFEKTINDALRTNKSLKTAFDKPINREEFWDDYYKFGFTGVLNTWLKPKKIPFYLYLNSNYIHNRFIKTCVLLFYIQYRLIKKIFGK